MPNRHKIILVVEDSPSLLESVAKCLLRAGFGVTLTSHYEQALATIRSNQWVFDAILTDIDMPPGPDGIMLAQSVRGMEAYKKTPIFIMSVRSDDEAKRRAEKAGVTDWVVKDYGFNTVLRALQSALVN